MALYRSTFQELIAEIIQVATKPYESIDLSIYIKELKAKVSISRNILQKALPSSDWSQGSFLFKSLYDLLLSYSELGLLLLREGKMEEARKMANRSILLYENMAENSSLNKDLKIRSLKVKSKFVLSLYYAFGGFSKKSIFEMKDAVLFLELVHPVPENRLSFDSLAYVALLSVLFLEVQELNRSFSYSNQLSSLVLAHMEFDERHSSAKVVSHFEKLAKMPEKIQYQALFQAKYWLALSDIVRARGLILSSEFSEARICYKRAFVVMKHLLPPSLQLKKIQKETKILIENPPLEDIKSKIETVAMQRPNSSSIFFFKSTNEESPTHREASPFTSQQETMIMNRSPNNSGNIRISHRKSNSISINFRSKDSLRDFLVQKDRKNKDIASSTNFKSTPNSIPESPVTGKHEATFRKAKKRRERSSQRNERPEFQSDSVHHINPKPFNLFRSTMGGSIGSMGLLTPHMQVASKSKIFQTHQRTSSATFTLVKKPGSGSHTRNATTLVVFSNKKDEKNIGSEELASNLNLFPKFEAKIAKEYMEKNSRKYANEKIMVPYRSSPNEPSFLSRNNMKAIMNQRAKNGSAFVSKKASLILNVDQNNLTSDDHNEASYHSLGTTKIIEKLVEPIQEEEPPRRPSLNNITLAGGRTLSQNSKFLEESHTGENIGNNSSLFLNTSVADIRATYNVPEGKKVDYKRKQQIQAEHLQKLAKKAQKAKKSASSKAGDPQESNIPNLIPTLKSGFSIDLDHQQRDKKKVLTIVKSPYSNYSKRSSLQLPIFPEPEKTLRPPDISNTVRGSPGTSKTNLDSIGWVSKLGSFSDLGIWDDDTEEMKKRHQSAEKIQKFARWIVHGRKKDEICPFLPSGYKGISMVEMLKKEFESAILAKRLMRMINFPFNLFLNIRGINFLEVDIPLFSGEFASKKLRMKITRGGFQTMLDISLRETDLDSIIKEHQSSETIWPFMASLFQAIQSSQFPNHKQRLISTHGCNNSQINGLSRVDRRCFKQTMTLFQSILNQHALFKRKINGTGLKMVSDLDVAFAQGIQIFLKKAFRKRIKKIKKGSEWVRNLYIETHFEEIKQTKKAEETDPEIKRLVARYWFQRAVKEVKFLNKFSLKQVPNEPENYSIRKNESPSIALSTFLHRVESFKDYFCTIELRQKVNSAFLLAQPSEKLISDYLFELDVTIQSPRLLSKYPQNKKTISLSEIGLHTKLDLESFCANFVGKNPGRKWHEKLKNRIVDLFLSPSLPLPEVGMVFVPVHSMTDLGYFYSNSPQTASFRNKSKQGEESIRVLKDFRNDLNESIISEEAYNKNLFLRQFNYYMGEEVMQKQFLVYRFSLINSQNRKAFGKFVMNPLATKFVISIYIGEDSQVFHYRSSSKEDWEKACQWISSENPVEISNVLATQMSFSNSLIGKKIEVKRLAEKCLDSSEYSSSSHKNLYFSVQTCKKNRYIEEKFKRTEYNLFTSIVNLGLCYVRVLMFDSTNAPNTQDIQLFLFKVYPANSKTKMFHFCLNSYDAENIFGGHSLPEIMRNKPKMVKYLTDLVSMLRCHRCLLGGRLMIPSSVITPRKEKIEFEYDLENELMNQMASFTGQDKEGKVSQMFIETKNFEKSGYLQPKVHGSYIIMSSMRKFNGQFCLVILEKNINLKVWVFRLYFPQTCRRFVCYLYPNDLMRMDIKLLGKVMWLPKFSRVYWKASTSHKTYNEFREFAVAKMKEMDSGPVYGDILTADIKDEGPKITSFENKVKDIEFKRKEEKKKMRNKERTNILKELKSLLMFSDEKVRAKKYKKQGKSRLMFISDQRDFQEMFLWEIFFLELSLIPANFQRNWLLKLNKFRGIVREILHYDTVICTSKMLTYIEVMIEDNRKALSPGGDCLQSIPLSDVHNYNLFFRVTLLDKMVTFNDRVNLKDMIVMSKSDGIKIGTAPENRKSSSTFAPREKEHYRLRDLRVIGEFSVAKIQRFLFHREDFEPERISEAEFRKRSSLRRKSLVELFPTRASSKLKLISELTGESALRQNSNIGQIIYREVFDFNPKRVVIIVYRKSDRSFNFFVYNALDCSLFTKEFSLEEVKIQIPMAVLFLQKKKYHKLGFRIFKALKNNVIISMHKQAVQKRRETQPSYRKWDRKEAPKTIVKMALTMGTSIKVINTENQKETPSIVINNEPEKPPKIRFL